MFLSRYLALVAAAAVVAGCSSTKLVRIVVEPAEAAILLDGKQVGTGKYEKMLDFGKVPQFNFSAKLDRHANAEVAVKYEPATKTEYKLKLERLYSIDVPLTDFQAIPSATGMKLEFVTAQTAAYFDVLEKSDAIQGLAQVTENTDRATQLGGPVLSPTEDIFVYRVLRTDKSGNESYIWKQEVGSKATTRLVTESSIAVFPAFSHDGKFILFSSNRFGGKFALWRTTTQGTGRTKISSGLTQDLSSCMAPDNGSKIAYTSFPPDSESLQIWTIDQDGRMPTQVCDGHSPQISPDGKRILFLRKAQNKLVDQAWVMDLDGGSQTQLTLNEDFNIKDARWAPNGKAIVYSGNEGKDDKGRANYDIWLMNSDGSGKVQLTFNGSHDDMPSFDRQGEQIYFRSNRGTNWNIWTFKVGEKFSDKRNAFEMK